LSRPALSAILLGLIPSNLVCCDCERRAVGTAAGWQGHLVDLDDDGRDEVADRHIVRRRLLLSVERAGLTTREIS
jgi:hypothetical protein